MLQIDRQLFEYTMDRLNEHFEMAETADCSTYCEGCLACLTAYFIYICTETHYEKVLLTYQLLAVSRGVTRYNYRGQRREAKLSPKSSLSYSLLYSLSASKSPVKIGRAVPECYFFGI